MSSVRVSLIGYREREGILTGRKKRNRRGEYWQVYWTKVPPNEANNICQWVPADQIVVIGHTNDKER